MDYTVARFIEGGIIMAKEVILQAFEWYLPNDGSHWQLLASKAEEFSKLGFTGIWLPPAYKGAAGKDDVGYGVYDLFDLGEFDQKGTIPTKYGSKDEYLAAIHSLKEAGLAVYADIVFNHMLGADEVEKFPAVQYNQDNRKEEESQEEEIEAWTKFTFPGRKGTYDDYVWTWQNFSGVDYDERTKSHALFNIGDKGWNEEVDGEKGNFDYLMGCDLDMNNADTINQLEKWGSWFYEQTGVDGFRLDAVKHIEFSYYVDWLMNRNKQANRELFVVGEYWSEETAKLEEYLKSSGNMVNLFDVPLHFQFYNAANSNGEFDMSTLFDNTFVFNQPDFAVTFVDNHDTQIGQSLESWVDGWFKLHAYASILLRQEGTPVVFWGDLYGIPSKDVAPVGQPLHDLLAVRQQLLDGKEIDSLDDPNVIGWACISEESKEDGGFVVLMTNATGGEKEMTLHPRYGNKTFVDILHNNEAKITLDETGKAIFPVNDGQVSVYVQESFAEKLGNTSAE